MNLMEISARRIILAITASFLVTGCNAPLDTGVRAISAPVVDISLLASKFRPAGWGCWDGLRITVSE